MFFDNYLNLCNKAGKAPTTVAVELGLQKSSVTKWSKGGKPTAANQKRIADYFDVTVDYLLTGEQKEKPAGQGGQDVTFDDFTYALHNESTQLTEENKAKLLDMARMLKLAQEAQKNK